MPFFITQTLSLHCIIVGGVTPNSGALSALFRSIGSMIIGLPCLLKGYLNVVELKSLSLKKE